MLRAIELHRCQRNIEPRSGSGREFVLRDFQQSFEKCDVRSPRCDLRRRALREDIEPRDRSRNVVLRALQRVAARRFALIQRPVMPDRGEIEDLHLGGDLRVSHIERTDDRRLTRNREAERLEIDGLAVANEARIGLRKQRLQRFVPRDACALLRGTRELRLRSLTQRALHGIRERESQRLGRRRQRNEESKNEERSTAHHSG